jgi:hypothetical protein
MCFSFMSGMGCYIYINGVSMVQNLVVKTLKHFDNVISTCSENVVEVFESLTTSQDNASEWSDMLFQWGVRGYAKRTYLYIE